MENIEELLTLCRKWSDRENEVSVIDALTCLTEFLYESMRSRSWDALIYP